MAELAKTYRVGKMEYVILFSQKYAIRPIWELEPITFNSDFKIMPESDLQNPPTFGLEIRGVGGRDL